MIIVGKTDIGKKRPMNQDSFKIATVGKTGYLAVVCDGMGGALAGEIASAYAADCFTSFVVANYTDECDVNELLLDAVISANSLVHGTAEMKPECKGMGTTLVAVLLARGMIYTVNIGDSRLYMKNKDGVRQITRDHTLVQMRIDRGEITVREAMDSPDKHYITRCVGVEKHVEPDIFVNKIDEAEALLLCTDGLHGTINTEKLNELIDVSDIDAVESTVSKLISHANKESGSDNITAVLVRISTP